MPPTDAPAPTEIDAAVAETKTALEAWTEAGHQMIADAMARARAAVPPSMAPLAAATETALRQMFSHMVQGPHAWADEQAAHAVTVAAQHTPVPTETAVVPEAAGSTPPVPGASVFAPTDIPPQTAP